MMKLNLLLTLALTGLSLPAHANLTPLLVIDVSDPSQVSFTATDAQSQLTGGSGNDTTFSGFFPTLPGVTEADLSDPVGDLTASSQGRVFTSFRIDGLDLSFSHSAGFNSGDYVAGQRAFTGSSTMDLSLTDLPTPGTTGMINVNSLGNGDTIGSYIVVPEPTSLALIGLGGIALLSRRLAN